MRSIGIPELKRRLSFFQKCGRKARLPLAIRSISEKVPKVLWLKRPRRGPGAAAGTVSATRPQKTGGAPVARQRPSYKGGCGRYGRPPVRHEVGRPLGFGVAATRRVRVHHQHQHAHGLVNPREGILPSIRHTWVARARIDGGNSKRLHLPSQSLKSLRFPF